MVEILVKCPSCSSKMAVKGALVDIKLECPVCKKQFVIPAEVVAKASAQKTPQNTPESATSAAAEKSAPAEEEKTAQKDFEKAVPPAEEKAAPEKKPEGGIKINLKFPAKKPPQPPQSATKTSAKTTPPAPSAGAPAAAPMAVPPIGAPAAAPMAVPPTGAPAAAAPMEVPSAPEHGENKLKLQLPTSTPSVAPGAAKTVPRRLKYTKEYVPKKDAGYWIKFFFKVGIPVILLGIVIFFLVKFLIPSPESLKGNQLLAMTRKRQNRDGAIGISDIAKADFFPNVSTKKDFFYRDAHFEEIIVGEKETEVFESTVFFRRNGKKCSVR